MRSNGKGFFGLLGKVVSAVGLALLVATGSIIIFGKYTLDDYFAQQRKLTLKYYHQAIAGILQQGRADVNSISHLLPSLLDKVNGKGAGQAGIQELMDDFWFNIELDSGIESAFLYSQKGTLLSQWGEPLPEGFQTDSLIAYVTRYEAPIDTIQCLDDCIQYHAVPVLNRGEYTGVYIFGTPLTNLVLQFKAITGEDAGILIRHDDVENSGQGEIKPWGRRVIALTGFEENFPLLTEFAKAWAEGPPGKGTLFPYGAHSFEITLLPLGDLPATSRASLIIIAEISNELSRIRTATILYIANGLLSLLLSGGILLALLLQPTRRLRSLISVLPLLAKKDYPAAIQSLPKERKRVSFRDEIDVLDETAHSLVLTLKELDHKVEERTRRLAERSRDLLQERNFVANILDTAQVVIMTLDNAGRIETANKFAEKITGYTEKELKGRPFSKLLAPEVSEELVSESLAELISVKRNAFSHECALFSRQGWDLYVAWFHTRLERQEKEAPGILTVGLDLTERRKAEKQLAWLADHDPLTSLYNRRRFESEFERLLALNERYGQTGALFFFDIDQFKFINDSNGHKAGDELLVKVAERLRSVTRGTDVVARLGGDEFAVMVPQANREDAEKLAQKIYDEITNVKLKLGANVYTVSISAGLLLFPVQDCSVQDCSVQDLMVSADLAMYKVKESGRGGWRFATCDNGGLDEARQRIDWKGRIEKALEESHLVLFYQPIMRIGDRTISHYECLLRMVGDEGEIILPGVFIGIAHQTGLINRIDQTVLKLAVKKQAELMRQGYNVVLSVNLSGEMVSNPRFVPILTEFLKEYDVPASKFIFEVTETQAVANLEIARDLMQEMRKLGAQFALDDFGVGFSSMNYLKQLPVDYIKIDGSFVRHMAESPEDSLFVRAIHSVASGLGKKTIAEFVENDETLVLLQETGIDYAQGYGIGAPMPRPQFHSLPEEADRPSASRIQKL